MPTINIRRGPVRQLRRGLTGSPIIRSIPKTTHVNTAINRLAPKTPQVARNTIELHTSGIRPVILRGPFARAALGTKVHRAVRRVP